MVQDVNRCECKHNADSPLGRSECNHPGRFKICMDHRRLKRLACGKYHIYEQNWGRYYESARYGLSNALLATGDYYARQQYKIIFNIVSDDGHKQWEEKVLAISAKGYELKDNYFTELPEHKRKREIIELEKKLEKNEFRTRGDKIRIKERLVKLLKEDEEVFLLNIPGWGYIPERDVENQEEVNEEEEEDITVHEVSAVNDDCIIQIFEEEDEENWDSD